MRSIVLVSLLAVASVGFAQEEPAETPPPDYSRETLLQLFADDAEREEAEGRVTHHLGAIDIRALGMRWRIGYLPFFMPLSGSAPWLPGHRWPDPFALTGTQIASPPRTWRQQRDMSAELRRIERKVRESATVTVKPD